MNDETYLKTSGMVLLNSPESFVEHGLADHIKPLVHPPQLGDALVCQEG